MKDLELETNIGLYVKLCEKAMERAFDSEIKDRFDMVGSEWKVIIALAIVDGLTQKELAEIIFVEGSTLVPIIDRMEKQGFLKREVDSEDRRVRRVLLTSKSKRIVDPMVDCIINFRDTILDGISPRDLETTRNVLKKIANNSDKIIEKKGLRIPITILNKKEI